MPNGITKETFQGYPIDSKLDTLYDYIHDIHGTLTTRCPEQQKICGKRLDDLEKKKWFNRGISMTSGAISGILAVLGLKFGT